MFENRAPREEFDVTCAECGKATTVPFKPTGTRPVLCRDCFAKNRPPRTGGGGPGGFGGDRPRRDFGAPRGPGGPGGDRPMFDTTCTRCGSATQVPFQPTPGRDVFCRDCFRGSAGPR